VDTPAGKRTESPPSNDPNSDVGTFTETQFTSRRAVTAMRGYITTAAVIAARPAHNRYIAACGHNRYTAAFGHNKYKITILHYVQISHRIYVLGRYKKSCNISHMVLAYVDK
jgi:hypothetical protein